MYVENLGLHVKIRTTEQPAAGSRRVK